MFSIGGTVHIHVMLYFQMGQALKWYFMFEKRLFDTTQAVTYTHNYNYYIIYGAHSYNFVDDQIQLYFEIDIIGTKTYYILLKL